MRTRSLMYVSSIISPVVGVFDSILPQDSTRSLFIVQNKGNDPANLYFGSSPENAMSIEIGPGDVFEPFIVPTNEIWVSTNPDASASTSLLVITDSPITVQDA